MKWVVWGALLLVAFILIISAFNGHLGSFIAAAVTPGQLVNATTGFPEGMSQQQIQQQQQQQIGKLKGQIGQLNPGIGV